MPKQKSKRAWGAGSVEEYSPGLHRVRTRVKGKLRTLESGLDKTKAEAYADAMLTLRERSAQMKFRHLVELARHERWKRTNLKISTKRSEQSTLDNIARELGDLHPNDLSARDVREYLKGCKMDSTRRNRLCLISYCLQLAVDDDILKHNVARDVKLRATGRKLSKKELLEKVLWPHQQDMLIQELTTPKRFKLDANPEVDRLKRSVLLAQLLFALGTGCRLSEMWGVKREDVRDDAILICRSVGNEVPKGGDWREIPILPAARAAGLIVATMRTTKKSESEWLFSGRGGVQHKWSKPPRGWRELLKACGLKPRGWHWLRHTCATSLLAGWWSDAEGGPRAWTLEEVRALLGHSSVTVTEIYAHLLDDTAFKAAVKTFQKRSSDTGGGQVGFSGETMLSQLCESNTRPAVYETVSSASDNADSPANSFQNWNDSNSPTEPSSPDEKWARSVAATEPPPPCPSGPWDLARPEAVAP